MEQDEPTYAHPIIGFRCWEITNHGHLTGITVRSAWRNDRTTVTNCALRGHHQPAADCSCGLYAYYRPEQPDSDQHPVIGVVIGRGHAQMHPTGFRVEEAVIVALAATKMATEENREQLQHIAEEYGVPVVKESDLTTVAEQYGQLFDIETFEQQHPNIPPTVRQQQAVRDREETYAKRKEIFYTGYAIYAAFVFVSAIAFILVVTHARTILPGDSALHPLKNPVTNKILDQPPASLFSSQQSVHHPERWHVASASVWQRSQHQQWLRTFVDKNSEEKMPVTAVNVQQQIAWLANQAKEIEYDVQSRYQDIWTVGYLAAAVILFIVPLTFTWLWMVPLYRRRTQQLAAAPTT